MIISHFQAENLNKNILYDTCIWCVVKLIEPGEQTQGTVKKMFFISTLIDNYYETEINILDLIESNYGYARINKLNHIWLHQLSSPS